MSDANEQQDSTTPRKGGFGAFAQQYRDRWAADHPNAEQVHGDGAAASTPTPVSPFSDADAGPGSTPQA